MRALLSVAADIAVGLVVTGLVAPLALAAAPPWLRGRVLLALVCLACIGGASAFRRAAFRR